MVFLGPLLLVVAAALILAALFGADGFGVEFLGIDTSVTVVFFLGLIAGLAALWGLSLTRWGAKREWKQRRDQKRIDELAAKLDESETRRGRNSDDD